MEKEHTELSASLAEKSAALRAMEAELKGLIAAPGTEEARASLEAVTVSVRQLEARLASLMDNTSAVSSDVRDAVMIAHGDAFKEYRKRKRICNEMLDTILEGYNKPKKALIEELCIETDESVDFVFNSVNSY